MVVVVVVGKDNGGQGICIWIFLVFGKKFKFQNFLVMDGFVCFEGNFSIVIFCKNFNEVFIVGNFVVFDFGVCDFLINYYIIFVGIKVIYVQYVDQVII